ncbi:MFS transporter [Lactobacillus sp. ESL0679]|uniref:MFS transporter n=1 Tax=Lactobacillus sp. ESL0679 TaxID=2983209 RepID=UPI0023F99434|nr:MFS transporter [Lactobacillus sp. ESL0679]MDF7682160.1 MFS transporter [Lactobacillus sp. ESL0679]
MVNNGLHASSDDFNSIWFLFARALNIFRVGVVSFLIGTGCAGLAAGFPIILFGRLLEGIADGLCLPLMFSIILEQAPKKAVGTFMGIGSLVIAFAPAVGSVYGGLVLKYWSWAPAVLANHASNHFDMAIGRS